MSNELTPAQRRRNQELINNRRIIGGEQSKLMAVSPMKHAFCRTVWTQMLANTWFANEIDVSKDVLCYKNVLTNGERDAYDKSLAFLSNLDGIQLYNLTENIAQHITSPEVKMVLARQAYEEALHVDAYSTMIEAVSLDPMSLYMMFERDGVLAAKNEHILRQSEQLNKDFSPKQFALTTVANIALEGIYFYSGFLTFYALGKRGLMMNSADQIKFINRDEVGHLNFFIQILHTLMVENPEIFTDEFWAEAEAIIRSSVELEINWGCYIIKGGVLGLSDAIVSDYIKHLANQRWAAMISGYSGRTALTRGELYPGVKNPVEWVTKFSSINGDETNFFEGKVKSYQVASGGTLGWDEEEDEDE